MNRSALFAAAGAGATALVVAFVLRPTELLPRPFVASTPGLDAHATVGSIDATPRQPTPAATALVYVAGAVVHPGVYALAAGARAGDAVARAGGARPDADLVAVNLAAHVADGDEIAVPRIGEPPRGSAPRSSGTRKRPARSRRSARPRRRAVAAQPSADGAVSTLIDLNTADAAVLQTLPGIGPDLAGRIVTFRSLNGPFASVDGLADVSGMTPSRLDRIEPLLRAGPAQ